MKKNPELWNLVEQGMTYSQAKYYLRRKKDGKLNNVRFKPFTKEELIEAGITCVSEDGEHIFCGEKELQHIKIGKYKAVNLNKKYYYIHRIVYVWYIGNQPAGMVIDHKDNNIYNNNVTNLRLLTRGENVNRSKGTYQVRNQYTKNMTEEEVIALKEKNKAIKEAKEELHQEALRKNALKENHSKEVQKRARIIRDLKYAIAVAHKNYKESGSDKDRAIWKECIQAKKDFINKNPKITLKTKTSTV